MNWFEILKNSELVQSQRQGMKPIDIQKPFKRVKEDDDCFEQLKKYVSSFFKGTSPDIRDYSGELPLDVVWEDNTGFASISRGYDEPYPDEYYCRIKKWTEEKLANHDKDVEYRHQDSDLSYQFYTMYKSGGYKFQSSITNEHNGRIIGAIIVDIKGDESS